MRTDNTTPASFEWFKVHARQWLLDSDFEGLSTTAAGAWFLLTVRAWAEVPQGTLPADEATLAKWARMKPGEWKRNRDAVLPLFYRRGKRYGSKFLDAELRRATGLYESRKKGGEARRDKARDDKDLGSSADAEQVLSGVGQERSGQVRSGEDQGKSGSGQVREGEDPRARGDSSSGDAPQGARPADDHAGVDGRGLTDEPDDDPTLTAAERFRRRMRKRHGREFDAQATLHVVLAELGPVSLLDFLERDRITTGNPQALTNPTGYYRKLARAMAAEARGGKAAPAQAPETKPEKGECQVCRNRGMVGADYCDCAIGRGKREFDTKQAAKQRDDTERQATVMSETPEKVAQAEKSARETVDRDLRAWAKQRREAIEKEIIQ